MKPESEGLSIVIVSYNTGEYLKRCLTSLYQNSSDLLREVIVVDNASNDGSVEMVEAGFPEVTLIRNASNLGYATAVNQGIRDSSGRHILILNPDIEVLDASVRELWEFMERTPDAGIAAGKLLNPDGSLQMSCRTFYTLPVVLLRRTLLGKIFPNSRLVREHLMLDWDHNSDREVDWVTGACMMVRREAYEGVGGMDERFFLYFEDVDWCYRMKKHGWKVYYVPSSIMKHHYRRESARLLPDKKLVSHLLSTFRFYDKWGSALYSLKRERRVFSLLSTLALDILFINLAFILAYYFRYAVSGLFEKPLYTIAIYRDLMIFVNVVCLFSFVYSGLYRRQRRTNLVRDLVRVSRALLLSSLVIMATTYLTRTIAYSRAVVLVFWPISALLVTSGRAIQRNIHSHLRRSRFDLRRFAVIGEGEDAVRLVQRLLSAADGGFDFVGYMTPKGRGAGPDMRPLIGSVEAIPDLVTEHRIHEVYVSDRTLSRQEMGEIVIAIRSSGAEAKVVSEVTDILIRGSQLEDVGGLPVVVFPPASLTGTRLVTKYMSDFLFSLIGVLGLAVLTPLILVFQTLTFRNYRVWSRAMRQMGSVLAGRLSLVGPMRRVGGERIRPGVLGMWSAEPLVNEEAQKDGLDMYYIQNWSLSADMEIILLSLKGIPGLFGSRGSGSRLSSGQDKGGGR
jgi:GT2 family glycosyltransferase